MACEYCEMIQKGELVLFQDKEIAVMLHPRPALKGHVMVVPKEHYAIMEQIPHEVIAKMMVHASRTSLVLFEQLKAQGANVLIQNGIAAGQTIPHTVIQVLPRYGGDGISLTWDPQEASENDLKEMEIKLKEESQHMNIQKEVVHQHPIEERKEQPRKDQNDQEENYLIKHLRRVP